MIERVTLQPALFGADRNGTHYVIWREGSGFYWARFRFDGVAGGSARSVSEAMGYCEERQDVALRGPASIPETPDVGEEQT